MPTGTYSKLVTRSVLLLVAAACLWAAGCSDSDKAMTSQPKKDVAAATQPAEQPTAAPAELTGSYQIRNRKHGLLLRPREANNADGTPIVLYPAQPWKCLSWRLDPGPQTSYRPVNYFTSKTFQPADGPAGSAVPVLQASPDANQPARQGWKFIPLGDKFYKIVNAEKGAALTAQAGPTGGIEVSLAPWTGSEEQQWELLDLPAHLTM